jgi:hypothetical protein
VEERVEESKGVPVLKRLIDIRAEAQHLLCILADNNLSIGDLDNLVFIYNLRRGGFYFPI